jgi:hypothetical protein
METTIGRAYVILYFLLSRNSAVEFFSDTEAVIGSNPIVTTKKSYNVKRTITAG